MRESKLLTLVAVLGILACGACFLPPIPIPPRPPTAPAQVDLSGARCIRVAVTQAPGVKHLSADVFAGALMDAINARQVRTHIGVCSGDPGANEALWQVGMVLESASGEAAPDRPGWSSTTYRLVVSTTLTVGKKGTPWPTKERVYTSQPYLHPQSEGGDAWSDSTAWLAHSVAPALVRQMFSVN